jgi:tetratricopeptide (TPR) repeat protein
MTNDHIPSPYYSLCFAVLLASAASAQDRVTYSTGRDDSGRATVSGTIVDYTGVQLTLRSAGGGEQSIPAARVVTVQTQWPPSKLAGDRLLAEAKFDEALQAYVAALRDEPRIWAQRQMLADSLSCLKALGRIEPAGEAFLRLVQSDPETLWFGRIPLNWQLVQPSSQLEQRANLWLQTTDSEIAQLIGASWLLATRHRAAAMDVLQRLAARGERRVASLATAQLWRTRTATWTKRNWRAGTGWWKRCPAKSAPGPISRSPRGLPRAGRANGPRWPGCGSRCCTPKKTAAWRPSPS